MAGLESHFYSRTNQCEDTTAKLLISRLLLSADCLKQPHVVARTAAELQSETKYNRQNATHYWEQFELYSFQGDQPSSRVKSKSTEERR